ncbi:transcriptional repressor LexA [Peptostreptococcus canis]|uniref:Repressor LexA n=1 Tax=Peptostreptococcus canis TaxID=1159213 RepID=A0ABR6TJ81_9FIRM|nr:transcriptional repressor LexA [Peptostreptococcus canis]MBC2575193.1 repressor LexA [Peptostreptococcus canis]MBP1997632.1 repressor LexA [Peptostreptococcus canis]
METFLVRFKKILEDKGISQAELSKLTGIRASSISDYYNGRYMPKQDKITLLANALDVSPSWLSCVVEDEPDLSNVKNIILPQAIPVPIVGTIAADTPIFADENIEDYLYMDRSLKIDFCLRVKGDSMIDAKIYDGDIALLKKQSTVENGEIGAIIIDNEATLKKIYKTDDSLILNPCNANYEPIIVKEDSEVYIAGKLVGVIHKF